MSNVVFPHSFASLDESALMYQLTIDFMNHAGNYLMLFPYVSVVITW